MPPRARPSPQPDPPLSAHAPRHDSTMSTASKPKVILAYSGGLDTSVILKWLCEKGFDVIAFCADVGQHHEDFDAVKAKAVSCGALKCVVTDLRREFVTDYIFEALKCDAAYETKYLLGTSVARPCIAKEMVRIAKAEGAGFVAHGATGKGNDQVRFEMCCQALDARLKMVAPWRDAEFIESFKGRKDLLAYCTKHGIPVDAKVRGRGGGGGGGERRGRGGRQETGDRRRGEEDRVGGPGRAGRHRRRRRTTSPH